VVSNLLPGRLSRMWQAFAAGDLNHAWPLARSLDPVCNACFLETNPVPVKELLSMAGLCRRDLRLPLVPVSEKTLTRLVQFFEGTLAALLEQDVAGDGAQGAGA
jgi:4-hydroxy-tetrahydrodipicolinate synthase